MSGSKKVVRRFEKAGRPPCRCFSANAKANDSANANYGIMLFQAIT